MDWECNINLKLHSGRWVEEHFNGNMYKKPLCFVDLWLKVLWVSGTWKLLPQKTGVYYTLTLSGQVTDLVWPSICFYYSSSLWNLSWIHFLGYTYFLRKLRPVLGHNLRGIRYIKQWRWLGEAKKKKFQGLIHFSDPSGISNDLGDKNS